MNLSPTLFRLWEDKYFVVFILFVALSLYLLTSVAWSVFPGRDFGTYVAYFSGLFEQNTPLKSLMTSRTFLSSTLITIGASNKIILNIFLFFWFFVSLLLCYLIGLLISVGHARTFLLVMSLNVPLMIFFHEISSDLVLQIFLIPYVAVTVLAACSYKAKYFVFLGFLTFCLASIRPSNQLFLILILLPFLKTGFNSRSVGLAGIFLIAYLVPVFGYSYYNYVRFDTFSIARGGYIFAHRIFAQDKIFDRNNGPASEALAISIENNLLPRDVYRQHDVSVEDIFSSGNKRMFMDIISLSDEVFGWDVNYKPLRDAAFEGIRENPGRFFQVSLMNLLAGYIRGYPSDGQVIRGYPPRYSEALKIAKDPLSKQSIFDRRFENFRSSRHFFYSNTIASDKSWNPEGKIFGQESLVKPWLDGLTWFPNEEIRNGSSKLGYVLRLMADKFPPIAIFIICTIPILFRLKEYTYRVVALISFSALLNSGVPIVFAEANIMYRVPYDFIFIYSGITGLFSSDKLLRLVAEVLPLKTNK